VHVLVVDRVARVTDYVRFTSDTVVAPPPEARQKSAIIGRLLGPAEDAGQQRNFPCGSRPPQRSV